MYTNINILSNALDATWKRNEVLTNNISNAETPNFKRSDVVFEDLLKAELKSDKLQGVITNSKHISINGSRDLSDVSYEVTIDDTYSTRADNNNVEIDVEMARRANNEILYNTVLTRMQGNIQKLKKVINEGK